MHHPITASTLSFMTEACASMLQLKQIHAYSIVSSFISNKNVRAGVFRFAALSPLGDVFYAHRMLDQLPDPECLCNTLVRGYAKSPFPSCSITLFNEMQRTGIALDEFTFNFLIKARSRASSGPIYDMYVALECDEIHSLVVKLGFTAYLFVQNSLLHLYAKRGCPVASRKVFNETPGPDTCSWSGLVSAHVKAGELAVARRVFNAMPVKDVVSWTSMISGYAQAKYSAEALELFTEMVETGHRPDEITLITVLTACKDSGNMEFGVRMHNLIEANGLGWMVSVCNALIDMYGKCGCIDSAWMVFKSMHRKSVISWNIMISTFADKGNPEDAFWLFRCMLDSRVAPDCFTMLALLRAHAKKGSVDEGCQLLQVMGKVYGVEAQVEHFGCVVAMLCQAGRLEEAYEVIVNLQVESSDKIWRCLLNACRTSGNMDLEEKVLMRLLMVNPGHPIYLALMHDICCIRANG